MFALIVMVIAACEVVIGLGIIVAAYRRRIPLNVDEMRSLRARMSATTYGWLVLAFPLAGTILIALGWRRAAGPQRGLDRRPPRSRPRFLSSIGALFQLLDLPVEERQLTSSLWD